MPGPDGGTRDFHPGGPGGPGGVSNTRWQFVDVTWCSFSHIPRGGEELEVRGSPLLVPLVLNLYSRMDHLDEVTACHMRMIDVANYDRCQIRRQLRILAEIAGMDSGDPRLGRQCPGDH